MIKTLIAAATAMLLSAVPIACADDTAPTATPQNLLNLLYVSDAMIEFCKIAVEPATATKMAADVTALEQQLGMDDAATKTARDEVKTNIATTKPDCSPTNENVMAIQGMLKDYAAQ